jgi:hypothetical protein
MSALARALGNASPKHRFEHDGTVYEVGCVDQRAKAEFELRLFEREKLRLEVRKPSMEPAEYEQQLVRLNRMYDRGRFGLLSRRGLAFFGEVEGMLALASILFGVDEAEMVHVLTARTAEVCALLNLVVRQSLPVDRGKGKEGTAADPPEAAAANAT